MPDAAVRCASIARSMGLPSGAEVDVVMRLLVVKGCPDRCG
jgi:hypothetical protein